MHEAKVMDGDQLNKLLSHMSEEQRDHLRLVISELVQCYAKSNDTHGLLLVSTDNDPMFKIICVNATDMEAAQLLEMADAVIGSAVTADAPPKEMFN